MPQHGHSLSPGCRFGVIDKPVIDEGHNRFVSFLYGNRVVHKVLGACASIAVGGDDPIDPSEPFFKLAFDILIEDHLIGPDIGVIGDPNRREFLL